MSNISNLLIMTKKIRKDLNNKNSDWYKNKDKYLNEININYMDELDKYPAIINVIKRNDFNIDGLDRLDYMLKMALKVNNNNISEHNASVKIGQRLVDEIVKPQLNK